MHTTSTLQSTDDGAGVQLAVGIGIPQGSTAAEARAFGNDQRTDFHIALGPDQVFLLRGRCNTSPLSSSAPFPPPVLGSVPTVALGWSLRPAAALWMLVVASAHST